MTVLDTENADRNLTSTVTVLTATPSASVPKLCVGEIALGDGSKNLDGTGGDFELTLTVGGVVVDAVQTKTLAGSTTRARFVTQPFPVPANAEVVMRVKSPNSADSNVDVTANLYAVEPAITIAPIMGVQTARASAGKILLYYREIQPVTVTVTDANGDPVDLTAYTTPVLRVENDLKTLIYSATPTIGGDDDNEYTFTPDATLTGSPNQSYPFALYDATTRERIHWGEVVIEYLPIPAP